jgi:hypothetical protein
MFKNVASQKIALLAVDSATGRPKTGDAANITAYVSKDYGTVTALADTSATEMSSTNAPGWYLFDVSQSETNADALLFSGKSTTSGIDIVGNLIYTVPPNFTALAIATDGGVKLTARLKKNSAIANFHFLMTDSTTHNPATGKTVTATRVIDNGSFGAGTIGSVTEIANGLYRVDLPAADLNGDVVTLRMTANGCDDLFVTLTLEP